MRELITSLAGLLKMATVALHHIALSTFANCVSMPAVARPFDQIWKYDDADPDRDVRALAWKEEGRLDGEEYGPS